MSRIYMHIHDQHGCGHYRAKFPLQHSFSQLNDEGTTLTGNSDLQSEEYHHDAYVFHRVPPESLIYFVQTLKDKGKKIAWDVDDDIFNIPSWMPSEESGMGSTWALSKVLDIADYIWVSTEKIKKVLKREDKTLVLPNLIDQHAFLPPAPARMEPLRILWCGGNSHERDLEVLLDPMKKLLKDYGDKIQFVYWGQIHTDLLEYARIPSRFEAMCRVKEEYGNTVWYLEGLPFKFYYDKLSLMRSAIALCPLVDCEFNRAKSNLKFLEMTMANSAVVATNLEPYHCINDGEDGILVEPGDESAWYDKIKYLIDHPQERENMTSLAREKVIDNFSWQSDNKYLWHNAFRSLV